MVNCFIIHSEHHLQTEIPCNYEFHTASLPVPSSTPVHAHAHTHTHTHKKKTHQTSAHKHLQGQNHTTQYRSPSSARAVFVCATTAASPNAICTASQYLTSTAFVTCTRRTFFRQSRLCLCHNRCLAQRHPHSQITRSVHVHELSFAQPIVRSNCLSYGIRSDE